MLLVNLGTPDAATPAAVRRFLAQFLGDPRVVEAPRWLWWLALHGVILRVRPRQSTHAYRQIWTPDGSPLLLHSQALAGRIQEALDDVLDGPVHVALGMTYGNPSIGSALEQLRAQGIGRLIVLPLYPQYSATTTGSVFDRVSSHLQRWRWLPELRFITHYHDDAAYIAAIAASIERQWAVSGRKHLVLSYHGVPRRYLLQGDPYHCQCQKTSRLIARQLQLADDEWSVSFQSQVGREEWLRPYTDELLVGMAREGRQHVTLVCPGFAADCLETLEEIAIRNKKAFLEQGGVSYDYVPALNASPEHVQALAGLIVRHCRGWPETGDVARSDPELARERALRLGAPR